MRKSIKYVVVIAVLSLLSACGYQLRGSGGNVSLASISPLYISGVAKTDGLYRVLRENFRSANVEMVDNAAEAAETLVISARGFSKNVHSIGSRGKVLEYELVESFHYKLGPKRTTNERTRKSGTVKARRVYTNPETEVLGRQHEERILRKDMWQQLASGLISRLGRQVN